VWSFWRPTKSKSRPEVGQLSVVAGLCGPKTDALAVWFRATLIQALLRRGRLDDGEMGAACRQGLRGGSKIPASKRAGRADLDALVAAME